MKKNLISKIEDLSINAWPSFKIELYDNWLIRFSHQYTLRTNCVEQLGPSTIALSEKIDYCESIYTDYNSPCTFKITPLITGNFDSLLAERGYSRLNETNVMTMPLKGRSFHAGSGIHVELSDTITNDWIFGVFRLNNVTNPIHHEIVPNMFKAIPKKTIVAKIMHDGQMAASGLGILDRNDLGLYAIYTHVSYRGRGYARAICNTILNKGKSLGAAHSYLQVLKNNPPAIHLYESLGYNAQYSYWFRQK
ncbi:MAG: GNAT family N-acetyltransferase [Lachnospiraceae bacterium]|nr:GNAT family N-acetyltransferase [Lachnospiraceae bacterium]